jgi:hypothetical protein
MTIIQKSLAKVLFKNLASAVCLGALFVLTSVSCQQAAPEASGTQTAALARGAITAPTPIYNQADLADIQNAPSGDYVLANDIDLKNWIPICDINAGSNPFTGTLDGAGYTITLRSFDSTVVSGRQYIGIFAESGDSAVFRNLNLVFEQVNVAFSSARFVGGLVSCARSTTFENITVSGDLAVSTAVPPPPSRTNLSRLSYAGSPQDLIPAAIPTDDLSVGGVAGYCSEYINSPDAFTSITNYANITAISRSTAVFVGGVVGFVNDSSISSSENHGNITGSGPGYNTSAGGIAGSIHHARVSDSSSSGAIVLIGVGGAADLDDSWQIYAGGLVGYSGGDEFGGSEIINSFATGDVTAEAPFPYAGGLVGYNNGYNTGYNNFTDPASNGSIVSSSYATGNVTAASVTLHGPGQQYGNIPYAGGLVGYSSITGSLIEDSYATGDVIAQTDGTYAWAGGIVGGNANDAVVNRTYATGSVYSYTDNFAPIYAPQYAEPGPAAGGIAGFNYYSKNTEVNNSVAFNNLINTNNVSQDVVHRVAGSLGDNTGHDGTLNNNLAKRNVIVTTIVNLDPGADRKDGLIIGTPPAQSDYAKLGWDFTNVWYYNGGYPTLR